MWARNKNTPLNTISVLHPAHVSTKIVHFYDKSKKICQITTNPKTNIFGYGAKPIDASIAQALKWPTWKRGSQWKSF